MGTINNAEKFDADFFGLSFEQTHTLLLEARLLLEYSYAVKQLSMRDSMRNNCKEKILPLL